MESLRGQPALLAFVGSKEGTSERLSEAIFRTLAEAKRRQFAVESTALSHKMGPVQLKGEENARTFLLMRDKNKLGSRANQLVPCLKTAY